MAAGIVPANLERNDDEGIIPMAVDVVPTNLKTLTSGSDKTSGSLEASIQVELSPTSELLPILHEIYKSSQLPNHSWSDQSPSPLSCIRLCKLYCRASTSKQAPVVTHCLKVVDTMQ